MEKRRLRGDMIEVYKIMHVVENAHRETFFSLSQNTRTWGHPIKLTGGRSRTNKRKDFFTQRIVKFIYLFITFLYRPIAEAPWAVHKN